MGEHVKRFLDYIREAEYPEELYAKFHDMPGSPTWLLSARVKKLDALIETLRKNAYAPAIKIFGSAADDDGKIPSAIDIFIDTSGYKLSKDVAGLALNEIMSLSSTYRGFLNPYLLINSKIYTKNNDSTKWVKIKSPSNLISNGKKGLPLTLFDRSFGTIAYRAISETPTIMHYVNKIEESRNATRLFHGYEVPEKLFEHYTEWEIALILGGH